MPCPLCDNNHRALLDDNDFVEGQDTIYIAKFLLPNRVSSNMMNVTAGRPKHCVSDVIAACVDAENSCHTRKKLGVTGCRLICTVCIDVW